MHTFTQPIPPKEYLDARAFMDYVKDGDPFFRVGLTFEQFIEQKNRMITQYQKDAKSTPNFYNRRCTKFDGYMD